MYVPAAFTMDDDACRAMIRERGFGLLIVSDGASFDTTPLPLLLDGDRLIGHVAKANPIWKSDGPALVVFNGPDAYVSPSWYPSKAETGKVVPTWNYVTVTAHVTMRATHEPAAKHQIVSALTDRHEERIGSNWKVTDAPDSYIQSLLPAIVGLELTITALVGKAKLSQNRPVDDHAGVAAALADTPIAAQMTR